MIDLPYTALVTESAAVEPLDLAAMADVISSEDDPARRHADWHPDFPREDDRDGVGAATDLTGWSSRQVRRLSDGLVVGTIGFFGPPEPADDGVPEVEVGYGLVGEARGQGLAAEALRALLLRTDAAGVRVRASVAPSHQASLKVLAACGFTGLRGTTEDGELVMVRPLP